MRGPGERYSIVKEPRDVAYRCLLEFLGSFCDEVLLVLRDPNPLTADVRRVLGALRDFQISVSDEEQWPGTRLVGHTARVYRYRLNKMCCSVLCSSADGLYDWLSPERPEDLCVLCNGTPVLITISHEREGYLDLAEAEYENLLREDKGLVIHRGEIMPPSAEPYRLFGAFLDEESLGPGSTLESALAKYTNMVSEAKVVEVVAAIRNVVLALKDDVLLGVVLQRWGAAPSLVLGASPSSVLNEIADRLEVRVR